MMNGPIQTKTKRFLLLQFHPSPRLPVCVSVESRWCERREEAVSTLLLEEARLMREKIRNEEKIKTLREVLLL